MDEPQIAVCVPVWFTMRLCSRLWAVRYLGCLIRIYAAWNSYISCADFPRSINHAPLLWPVGQQPFAWGFFQWFHRRTAKEQCEAIFFAWLATMYSSGVYMIGESIDMSFTIWWHRNILSCTINARLSTHRHLNLPPRTCTKSTQVVQYSHARANVHQQSSPREENQRPPSQLQT